MNSPVPHPSNATLARVGPSDAWRRPPGPPRAGVVLLFTLLLGLAHAQPQRRGVGLALYSADPRHSYLQDLHEIQGLGANAIGLFVVLMQHDIHSTDVHPMEGRTATNAQLTETIRAARELDLEVLVLPIVLLEHAGPREWRGRIDPPDPAAWFRSYRRNLLHLARLSAEAGANGFCVGSELSTMEAETEHWRQTVALVREEFPGWLTYSVNWDHLDMIEFWDAVDAVGVSAYFELARETTAPESSLEASWRVHRDALLAWHASEEPGMPLILTEVGYPSQEHAPVRPWSYSRGSPLDLEAQARCYRAFIRAWDGVDVLDGVFFYEWAGEGGGPQDDSYSPRGKPAEELIRDWYVPETPSPSLPGPGAQP